MEREFIAVLDFGSQYAHLIAKRVRHLGVYTQIFPPTAVAADLEGARGLILSGGPQSVFGVDAVPFNTALLRLKMPTLGLCYGHQLLAQTLGGDVRSLGRGEYGRTSFTLTAAGTPALLEGVPAETTVWMSHGDTVLAPPPGFCVLGQTPLCPVAAMAHESQPIFGLQYHPEVNDTPEGERVLANFLALTGIRGDWTMECFVEQALAKTRKQIGQRNVLLFLSGGVDSTVTFILLTKALGKQRVQGLFINNGFLRKGEPEHVMATYTQLGLGNVQYLDASEQFLTAIDGLVDPQEKRQAVGETFLRVREQFLARMNLDPGQWLLGQGTLYPDIIESGGTEHAQIIKSHHNRVGIINDLIEAGQVVEPLAELYKDEVRELGTVLGLPDEMVWRHPFPGPGLSINVLCMGPETTRPTDTGPYNQPTLQTGLERLLSEGPYSGKVLPVRSVGVQGDQRTYAPPVVLLGARDWDLLEDWSIRVTNGLPEVNRVVTLLAPDTLPALRAHEAYCTRKRLTLLAEAETLAVQALESRGLMREIFQLLVILLPLSDADSGECLVLRPVVSEDVMTARFAPLPWEVVMPLAEELAGLSGIRGVFYDVTHKPPATFGWE